MTTINRIYDITRKLFERIPDVPGLFVPSCTTEDRGNYLVSDIHICSHAGTHVDAPVHYLKVGQTIDEVPLDSLVGPVQVIDLTSAPDRITAQLLQARMELEGPRRILIKTRFSWVNEYNQTFPCLEPGAADLLVSRGYLCVGIDSPSIEAIACDGYVHRRLLGNGCLIIELLDLSRVSPGRYQLVALPLPISGCDGSPARVILMENNAEASQ